MTTQTTTRRNAETMPNPEPWWSQRTYRPSEYRCTGTWAGGEPTMLCSGDVLTHAENGARVVVTLHQLADVEPGEWAAEFVFVDTATGGRPPQMVTAGMVLDLVANRVLRRTPRRW